MKSGKVTNVRYGNVYNGQHGALHSWWVRMDNGDTISVNTKQEQAPWSEGQVAWYTLGEMKTSAKGNWYKAKKEKAPDAPATATGGGVSYNGAGRSGDVQHEITVSAYLKSIIESGAAQAEWEPRLNAALLLHDSAVAKRKVTSNYKPEGHTPQGGPPAYQPPAAEPTTKEDDDLPF